MVLAPVFAAVSLCAIAFAIGGLPIIDWVVRRGAKKQLTALGTGNLSVSAAFYHGGTAIGLLAVLSEALKGMAVVWLARSLFAPDAALWEIVALIALVAGRYTLGRGAGTTNVVWGYVAHDWVIALTVWGLSAGLFALVRRRQVARLGVLVLIPLVEAARRPDEGGAIAAATLLSLLIAGIYQQIPDDLALSPSQSPASGRKMFQYLRGQEVIGSLNDKPHPAQMGQKAATLAQLKRWGYAVPDGWIVPLGTSTSAVIAHLEKVVPTPWQQPWIVRSSALDEDGEAASAAGQYQSIGDVYSAEDLAQAIEQCRAAYQRAGAVQYRRDRGLADHAGLPLLVQKQITGVYSGVAFSRDPVEPGAAVVVEAVAGGAVQVVSGQVTPAQYRLEVDEQRLADLRPADFMNLPAPLADPEAAAPPPTLIHQVATLARHLELRYHGLPQDIEWTFDGTTLWLLQARPITTLNPLWTRKIAAEVIPGVIRPLTWSINRPLTCGVWGRIFTLVLGDRAQGLDFGETATLHYSRAYFNATLLGQIFRRMGLPAESLEFLTLGAKFSKPPLGSTVQNIPGLLRLLGREWRLRQDFAQDDRLTFAPTLAELRQTAPETLAPAALLARIEQILQQLETATYYSILAPLSFALRRSLLQVPEATLDPRHQPEVASLQAVQALAATARQHHPAAVATLVANPQTAWATLAATPDGAAILQALDEIVERYGYLSEVGTDIAVPTWREDPQPVRDLFGQLVRNPPPGAAAIAVPSHPHWRQRQVQQRLDLKGRVATVYLTLLAELRWSLLAAERWAIAQHLLHQPGDAFFLTWGELRDCLAGALPAQSTALMAMVAQRRSQFAQHQQQPTVPFMVYGNDPPPDPSAIAPPAPPSGALQGIGASAGIVTGRVKIMHTLQTGQPLPPQTVLVVPYTDAGWAPLLAQAAGLIAEVGGRLSHGAIVAREYKIPAVMNVTHATQRFQDGQWVRLDGRAGTVALVSEADAEAHGGDDGS